MKILILVFCLGFVGCASSSARLVSQGSDFGVIAYIDKNDGKLQSKIDKAVHCYPYTVVSDEFKSETRYVNYTRQLPTQVYHTGNIQGVGYYSGSTTGYNQVPETYSYQAYWRELTYKCNK